MSNISASHLYLYDSTIGKWLLTHRLFWFNPPCPVRVQLESSSFSRLPKRILQDIGDIFSSSCSTFISWRMPGCPIWSAHHYHQMILALKCINGKYHIGFCFFNDTTFRLYFHTKHILWTYWHVTSCTQAPGPPASGWAAKRLQTHVNSWHLSAVNRFS